MDKLPWNHNNHFHTFLLKHVPANCESALDIGCGIGEFASQLAPISKKVDAIDPDQHAITWAKSHWKEVKNVQWQVFPFDENWPVTRDYQFVSAVASLHHMELTSAVAHMKRILKPGGVLAILGLYKEASFSDSLYSLASIPVNYMYSPAHTNNSVNTNVATTPPNESIKDIRSVMNELLPNHQFRRHLLWRFSIIWKKPLNP